MLLNTCVFIWAGLSIQRGQKEARNDGIEAACSYSDSISLQNAEELLEIFTIHLAIPTLIICSN